MSTYLSFASNFGFAWSAFIKFINIFILKNKFNYSFWFFHSDLAALHSHYLCGKVPIERFQQSSRFCFQTNVWKGKQIKIKLYFSLFLVLFIFSLLMDFEFNVVWTMNNLYCVAFIATRTPLLDSDSFKYKGCYYKLLIDLNIKQFLNGIPFITPLFLKIELITLFFRPKQTTWIFSWWNDKPLGHNYLFMSIF